MPTKRRLHNKPVLENALISLFGKRVIPGLQHPNPGQNWNESGERAGIDRRRTADQRALRLLAVVMQSRGQQFLRRSVTSKRP